MSSVREYAFDGEVAVALDDFERQVLRSRRHVWLTALSILQDRGEAEDAVQEILVKAWRAYPRIDRSRDLTRWLTTVAVNHCISRRRALTSRGLFRTRELSDAEAAPFRQPTAELQDLQRALARLSRRQRAAITLNYLHGYSIDECAQAMHCAAGTVRSHLGRALAAMRKEMGHD